MITDADRQAAEALRAVLADLSGFWHRPGDDSPICQALARHRIETERRLRSELAPKRKLPRDRVADTTALPTPVDNPRCAMDAVLRRGLSAAA